MLKHNVWYANLLSWSNPFLCAHTSQHTCGVFADVCLFLAFYSVLHTVVGCGIQVLREITFREIKIVTFLSHYTHTHTHTHTHTLLLFRAALTAYGSSQARGWIGATAAVLCYRHSNVGSEPHLWPAPQLTATLDPWPTEQGQGWNLRPHGY